MCGGGEAKQRTTNRPPDNAFQQQKLKAWQPLLTPSWVIGTFSAVGVLFVALGVIIIDASGGIFEFETAYQDEPMCPNGNKTTCTPGSTGNIELTLGPFTRDIKGEDLFFYYKLTNFYQNHRRYVKSRSDPQLQGELGVNLDSCAPLDTWKDPNDANAVEKTLYPCGLIANSVFTDEFDNAKLVKASDPSNPVDISAYFNSENIAWPSDKNKFTDRALQSDETNIGPGGFALPQVTDPHFMVWMRTAGLPTFKKLYAIFENSVLSENNLEFKKGDVLKINVKNVFKVKDFGGEKFAVISTTSWLGGKNSFLGYSYVIVGVICLVLAVLFFAKHKMSPRALGDMEYFNWPALRSNKQSA